MRWGVGKSKGGGERCTWECVGGGVKTVLGSGVDEERCGKRC